jgi:hypothetical protein
MRVTKDVLKHVPISFGVVLPGFVRQVKQGVNVLILRRTTRINCTFLAKSLD